MAKEDETPGANPAEIENLIEQIQGTNLEPGTKEKVERLLRTVVTPVELLQRRDLVLIGRAVIKKDRELLYLEWVERRVLRFKPPAEFALRVPSLTKKCLRYCWLSSFGLPHGTSSGNPLHSISINQTF